MCRKMDGTGDHHNEQDKRGSKEKILHVLTHLWNIMMIMVIKMIMAYECVWGTISRIGKREKKGY
jgi:hypothetical protein